MQLQQQQLSPCATESQGVLGRRNHQGPGFCHLPELPVAGAQRMTWVKLKQGLPMLCRKCCKIHRENNKNWNRQGLSQQREKLAHYIPMPACYHGICESAGKYIRKDSEWGLAQARTSLQKPSLEPAVALEIRSTCTKSIFYVTFTGCQSYQMAQKHLSRLQCIKCFHNRLKLSDIFKLLSEPICKTNEIINFSSN